MADRCQALHILGGRCRLMAGHSQKHLAFIDDMKRSAEWGRVCRSCGVCSGAERNREIVQLERDLCEECAKREKGAA